MQVADKVVVVTGAGSGIGRAMVEAFVKEGAKSVIAADLDGDSAKKTADDFGCFAMTCDVSCDRDVKKLIDTVEADYGPIALFCSNAGLGTGLSEQSPDSEWQISWDVNVMSHVYAARHLVPAMIERGGGYFLNTASAAGLLNQIGGAAYGVTKHAAIGFGEWLALTYKHQGIKVSMLCPQAVRTPMTMAASENEAGGVQSAAQDGMIEPEDVANSALEGLKEEKFLILPHPEVADYMARKAADYDRWLGGMNRLHQALST